MTGTATTGPVTPGAGGAAEPPGRFRSWLLEGLIDKRGSHLGPGQAPEATHKRHSWWRVMCLTGVDYFSTLGYQPGIAFLAAGLLSPLATIILVLLTLFGALPVYRRVAAESPHGQGSIAMLERLLPFWRGKLFVLGLLGFALTDFIITITLSAADAHVAQDGRVVTDWTSALTAQHGDVVTMIAISLTLFPKLALGMSGFETGVAVMSHVSGDPDDDPARPAGRIRHTQKMLTIAASIMSVYLIASSLVTTVLIPAEEFEEGGAANGRALAYLAHNYLGNVFGTVYDVSTILILWFAGASAMAGMLNLIPRYLP